VLGRGGGRARDGQGVRLSVTHAGSAGMCSTVSSGILVMRVMRRRWCSSDRIVSMVSGKRSSRRHISRESRTVARLPGFACRV
jgi:hypothetical protein